VRVNSDFLGKRFLEVVKGQNGQPSAYTNTAGQLMVMNTLMVRDSYRKLLGQMTNDPASQSLPMDTILTQATNQLMEMIKAHRGQFYRNALHAGFFGAVNPALTNFYYIPALEEPALSDRLAAVAISVQQALPSIFSMTNQLAAVLSNANSAVSQINGTLAETRPTLTNLAFITGNLRDPNGSLGNWLLPTNLTAQLSQTLLSARETLNTARGTLDTADTNVTLVATDLDQTLQHLSDLTSNLAWQVHVNSNLVSEISTTILHTDDLVQGLKREWFLRGAFKKKHSPPVMEPQSK
jgi:enamine deaminase RidA (YjgF/YER057c/UK114 family)